MEVTTGRGGGVNSSFGGEDTGFSSRNLMIQCG